MDHLVGTYGGGFVEVVGSNLDRVRLLLSGEPVELRCIGSGGDRRVLVQVDRHPEVEIPLAGTLVDLLGQIRECVLVPPTTAAPSADLFVVTDDESEDGAACEVYWLPAEPSNDRTNGVNGESEL